MKQPRRTAIFWVSLDRLQPREELRLEGWAL
jgi:hypothetical protein